MGIPLSKARRHVIDRDTIWPNHVKRSYGIDVIKNHDVFDIELNSDRLSKKQIVSTIAELVREKKQD